MRIGELLVKKGLLSQDQVDTVLAEQAARCKPFGVLAERLFGLPELDIETVWAEQYELLAPAVEAGDLTPTSEALALLERRQAWQFRLLPLRRDDDEFVIATVRESLPRALRFVMRHVPAPVFFVISEPNPLGEALMKHYPMDGMDAGMLRGKKAKWGSLAGDAA